MEALAAPALDGRAAGTAGDRLARALIAARFACAGLRPGGDDGTYEQAFTAGEITSANVIGVLPGSDPVLAADRILVTAHHDHLGDRHLGANDNASGVAALLGIAETLAADPPARTIVFIAFGGEEAGLLGSTRFAAHPPAPLADVVQQINLDMVGTARGRVAAMGTFRGLAATTALRALIEAVPRLRVGLGGVARGSDHEPLCARGIPYVFFWTPDRRCYHRRCDTPDQLDYPGLVAIAGLAADLTRDLANSARDLRALRARHGCGLPRR